MEILCVQGKQQIYNYPSTLQALRHKANSQILSPNEEQTIYECSLGLRAADEKAASKAHFLCCSQALKDPNGVSKAFFNKLASKCNRTALATIHLDNGTILKDGVYIANACTQYFGDILSKPHQPSPLKTLATYNLQSFVQPSTSLANASRLETPFDQSKLSYALQ